MSRYKYVEYRKGIVCNKFNPIIMEVDKLPHDGFRSMYQVDAKGKSWIKEHGLRGFGKSGNPVWSSTLFIEFDDKKDRAEDLYKNLKKDGIAFDLFHSGNRSYHFHIQRVIEPSVHVPFSDKKFVTEVAPEADMSIYSHLHPFRLAGCIHDRTGKKKKLLRAHKGSPYEVKIFEKPQPERNKVVSSSVFEDEFIMALTRGFSKGSRNEKMYWLAASLRERGERHDLIEWFVRNANLMNSPPLDDYEIDKILEVR